MKPRSALCRISRIMFIFTVLYKAELIFIKGNWQCRYIILFIHILLIPKDLRDIVRNVALIFYTLIIPTFLYGSENWTLTASQKRRIEAAEMKLLRPLAGYTLYDHKTNNSIRKELRITSILDKIDEYRKKWFLHIHRMSQNRIPLKSYNYRPQGRRSIGRPKKRWREQL